MRINLSEIPEDEIIDEIETFLRENLPQDYDFSRDGKKFEITSEGVSKRKVKFQIRKYLAKSGLKGNFRLLADSKDSYEILFRETE